MFWSSQWYPAPPAFVETQGLCIDLKAAVLSVEVERVIKATFGQQRAADRLGGRSVKLRCQLTKF